MNYLKLTTICISFYFAFMLGKSKGIASIDNVFVPMPVMLPTPYIVYKDTCDSQLFKTIIDVETHSYEEMDRDMNLDLFPIGGRNGKKEWYGMFQISPIYLDGCKLAKILNWTIDDMLDPRKGLIVVIAKTIRKIDRFKDDYKRLPTKEELARIYNGGYSNFKKGKTAMTDKYAKEFNQRYSKKLGGKIELDGYLCKN